MSEWLEEIKEHFRWTLNNSLVPRLHDSEIEWLIEQAERYEDLLEQVKQIEKVSDYNADLRMKYERALEFYADEDNYRVTWDDDYEPILHDGGEKACQALERDND